MSSPPSLSKPPRVRDRGRDRAATRAWKAVGVCVLSGTTLALASPTAPSIESALSRKGLHVVGAGVVWLDPPGIGPRRALVLASEGASPSDVYAVTARTGAGDRVVDVSDVSNLTRSPDAAEADLTAQGRWAAFSTRIGNAVVAVTLVDTSGAPEALASSGDRGARLRAAITRWQQTGRLAGYGLHRFELTPRARHASVMLVDGALRARLDDRAVRVDTGSLRVIEGERFVQARPRLAGTTGWLTWMVDTVRAIPWIGAEPIAWAEHVAFGLKDDVARARNRVSADHSQSEVAEDLADVLHAGPASHLEGRVADWPPERLRSLLSPPLAREGQWSAAGDDDPFIARNPGAPPAFYQSFVRTDRERPDTRVYVTLWDPRQVELHVVPGSQEPIGAGGETGTGTIPRDARTLSRVAAGFNGGFQAMHGEWGLSAEGVTLLPAKPWGATIIALEDGSTGLGSWPNNITAMPAGVAEFRQNLTALVEDGVYNPFRRTFWGGNVPSSAPGDEHTCRTGVCMTREGYLAYFWGEDLTPRSLGDGMIAARCSYGVHLDMNGANTGFEFLRVTPDRATQPLARALSAGEAEGTVPSAPGFHYRARRMVRGMHEMSFPRYIKRDPRDFFYLMLRAVLPGAPLTPPVSPAQQGEGQWHVAGLSELAFPWPMARTRVRPDPSRPDRWVNLVRIDARRVAFAPANTTDAIVARVIAAPAPPTAGSLRMVRTEQNGAARWGLATEGDGIEGTALTAGMSVTRAMGIDADGFLVYAVADRAAPDLVARALDLAGCRPERLALPTSTAIALSGDRDVAGAAIDATVAPTLALISRPMRGGVRMFPEIRPVPPSVWYDAQHRRVRYSHGENGMVEVHVLGGQTISTPIWGTSGRSQRDASVPTPPQ